MMVMMIMTTSYNYATDRAQNASCFLRTVHKAYNFFRGRGMQLLGLRGVAVVIISSDSSEDERIYTTEYFNGLEVRRYAPVWYTGTSLVGLKSYRHFFLANCHTRLAFTVHSAVHEIRSVDCQENR